MDPTLYGKDAKAVDCVVYSLYRVGIVSSRVHLMTPAELIHWPVC